MLTLRLLGNVSLDSPDGPVTGRAALRHRIALLALLAVEHPRPLSRDALVAYLWPESDTDEARHHLRDSLYILRSALGDDSVLSTGDDLRLNPGRLTCDLWEFEAALARGDASTAVGHYQGSFLSGFHLSGSEEFERWLDGERARLSRRYAQALEQLADIASRAGKGAEAIEWWCRLAGADPYNSRVALRYMQALVATGDRAGALRHAGVHSKLLADELGATPDGEVVALAQRLRTESPVTAEGPPPAPFRVIEASGEAGSSSTPLVDMSKPPSRWWLLPAALMVAVLVGFGILRRSPALSSSPALNPRRVAVAVFQNHTGRPDLDDLGSMTADWIIRGLMETPLIEVTDLEAVYADEVPGSREHASPRTLARRTGAGLAIAGNYYRSGDSVLFQAGIMDVASGRVLRSFAPVSAPMERPAGALEGLREGIAGGLGALLNPANQYFPVDPELKTPPSYEAYREFIAGLKSGKLNDWESEIGHYRRSLALDPDFIAPLVQLAYRATWVDQCGLTDSIATALQPRRAKLSAWDRLTIDLVLARCRGDMESAVGFLRQRAEAYPGSLTARRQYAWALQHANQPRTAQTVLERTDPELDPPGRYSREESRTAYWSSVATSHHVLHQYRAEAEVTERWRDSTSPEWFVVRGRALSALGRVAEVRELFATLIASPIDTVAEPGLTVATELAVHGHPAVGAELAESILVRLELGSGEELVRVKLVAWANRLLGRTGPEKAALARIVGSSDADPLEKLKAEGRIAVLSADTIRAQKVDRILAALSNQPLENPIVRGAQIVSRAHIAAGLGRREQAVRLLQEASTRGMVLLGASYAFHQDLLLTSLRNYPPFEALLSSAWR
jgi:DNA-binding SARP family transcriptional activator